MHPNDHGVFDDIEKYSCRVLLVMAGGGFPPFSYSIGITQTPEKPEIDVVGLKEPIARFVINDYHQRLRAVEKFLTRLHAAW
jgi:hypothetical protein